MLILDELFQLVDDCQPIQPEWTTVIYENDDDKNSSVMGIYKLKTVRQPRAKK